MPRWGDEVVTLDDSDSIRSALAKLEHFAAERPVVVLSPGCGIADSALTYRLLVRASERNAVPLVVVSGNPAWRQLAREQGLRSFSSLGSLRRSRRGSALSSTEELADRLLSTIHPSSLKQVWPVLGVAVAVCAAVGYVFLPVMKVSLRAPAETLNRDVSVKVDVTTTKADSSSMTIPGRTIEHRFSISDFIPTTGSKQVGKEKAKGEVTLFNSSSTPVTIPAGTSLFSASGAKFTTTQAVTVGPFLQAGPASTPSGPVPGAGGIAGKVPVVAVEAGEKGNVPALAISRIDGDAFRGLTAVNEQPLGGGTEATARTVSAEDRAKLKESLFQKAQSQSLSELTLRVRQSESLITHSLDARIDGEEYDRAQDEEADQLKGTVYVVASALAFGNQDLNSVIESDWKNSGPKGYRTLQGNLMVSPPAVTESGSRTASLSVKVTGKAEPVVDADKLIETVRGSSVPDARMKLGKLEGGFRLQGVDIWPQWAPRAFRVEVQTVQ